MTKELPQPGQRIGRYRVEKMLGEGGMGAVFAATNDVTGRAVAIKWMLPQMATSAEAVARFLAEARATARIEHPNVIQVLDVGQDGPAPFLVMERLRGESLGERLERVGRLSVQDTLRFLIPACRGIAEAHAEGIIHRDLKPDNIFLCEGKDGSPRPPKVLDFGISKLYEEGSASKLTQTGAIMGTPLYMSPEQISARLDPDAAFDIYAMGVVLYECLSGRPPFHADSLLGLLQRIGTGDAVPLHAAVRDVPSEVSDVVMKAMHVDRSQRYGTIGELISALEALQKQGHDNAPTMRDAAPPDHDGSPATGPLITPTQSSPRAHVPPTQGALPPTHTAPGGPPPHRDRTPMLVIGLGVALLAVLLIVGGGVAYLVSRADSGPPAPPSFPTPNTPSYPTAPSTPAANAPQIDLTFGGGCAPRFTGRVMVVASQGTITLTSTTGANIDGLLTLGLPAAAVERGSVELSTQGRVDAPDTIVHVMQTQSLWMNMAQDASGVLTSGAPDPIRGAISIRRFDGDEGVADLTFQNVVLQNGESGSLCTIGGTLQTHGPVLGY